jgi:RNase P subunit RPR2
VKLNVSISRRIKQLFCKHDGNVGWSCCSEGINRKDGYWYLTYECIDCGFTYGKWLKADSEEVNKLFDKEIYKIK